MCCVMKRMVGLNKNLRISFETRSFMLLIKQFSQVTILRIKNILTRHA